MGTSRYPSPAILKETLRQSETELITLSLRRQSPHSKGGESFWKEIRELNISLLPNTAGCFSAKEAITTAQMARDLFDTHWIKLEVIGNEYALNPNPFELVEAARILCQEGFAVFPYTTDDLSLNEKLIQVGCPVLMPWGAPIGSGRGLANPYALKTLRHHFKETPLIIDAGLGRPSDAAQAMEMGYDAVLLNTAISEARDPVGMAVAFRKAVEAGRLAYESGIMPTRDFSVPSTPTFGKAAFHASYL